MHAEMRGCSALKAPFLLMHMHFCWQNFVGQVYITEKPMASAVYSVLEIFHNVVILAYGITDVDPVKV